jgi:hypothetical protein
VVSRSLNVLYIIAHLRYGASLTSHSPYTFRSADLFKWLYHERVLHLVRRAQKSRKLEEQAFRQAGRVCAKGVAWILNRCYLLEADREDPSAFLVGRRHIYPLHSGPAFLTATSTI